MFFNADPNLVFDSTNPALDPASVTHEKVATWFQAQKERKDFLNATHDQAEGLVIQDGVVVSYRGSDKVVTIPATHEGQPVTAIGKRAFEGAALEQVILPQGLTSIGEWAFCRCVHLRTLELPATLATIGAHAFQGCRSLLEISIPAATAQIGSQAFALCDNLVSFTVDPANPAFSDKDGVLFDKAGATLLRYPAGRATTAYKIPEGTRTIAREAFKNDYRTVRSRALEEVTFPASLAVIESNAFTQCSLRRLTVPAGVELHDYAFSLNQRLEYVELEEGITALGEGVLAGLDGYAGTLVLPQSLRSVGYRAFDRLAAANVVLPDALERIEEEAFVAAQAQSWHIPASVTVIDERAFYLAKTKSVSFATSSQVTTLNPYVFSHCRELEDVSLPPALTHLADGAFSICTSLRTLELPAGLRSLEDVVFAGSGLVMMDMSGTRVVVMGDNTFIECAHLVKATLPATLQSVGRGTFEKCASLHTVVLPRGFALDALPASTFKDCTTFPVLQFKDAETVASLAKEIASSKIA